jgi:predicted dehydrogenase
LLEDRELDAILVSTPVVTHFELASQSLEAGKHTFVEKPLTTSRAEAEELIELSTRAERVLMCGYTFIYSPPVRAIKQILEHGDLGDLYYVSSSRVNLGPYRSDVSVLSDLGPHDFSILRYWLGEMPNWITVTGRDAIIDGNPDVAFVTMKFPSRLVANLEMSWLAPSKLRRTVLVGSEKMVVYEDGAPEPIRIFDRGIFFKDPETFGEFQLSYRTGDVVSPYLEAAEPIAIQLEEFVEAVGRGSPPPDHAELCVDVVRLVEASERSLQNGGLPVSTDGRIVEHSTVT